MRPCLKDEAQRRLAVPVRRRDVAGNHHLDAGEREVVTLDWPRRPGFSRISTRRSASLR